MGKGEVLALQEGKKIEEETLRTGRGRCLRGGGKDNGGGNWQAAIPESRVHK